MLRRDGLHLLDFAPYGDQRATHQGHQRLLLVTLQDDSDVAHPRDGCDDQAHHELVLVWPLARHDVPENALREVAANHDALQDLAVLTRVFELPLPLVVLSELQVGAVLYAVHGDVEVVHADQGNRVASTLMAAALFSQPTAHDAPPAPSAKRDM